MDLGDGLEIKNFIREIRNGFINQIDNLRYKYINEYKRELTENDIKLINDFCLFIKKEIIEEK
jgi:hypothetical protein